MTQISSEDVPSQAIAASVKTCPLCARAFDTEDLEFDLVAAAHRGDTERAQALIKAGAISLHRAAIEAARTGKQSTVAMLLKLGDIPDCTKIAATAAREGHKDLALWLNTRGADINAIMIAAARGGHNDFALGCWRQYGARDLNGAIAEARQGGHIILEQELVRAREQRYAEAVADLERMCTVEPRFGFYLDELKRLRAEGVYRVQIDRSNPDLTAMLIRL